MGTTTPQADPSAQREPLDGVQAKNMLFITEIAGELDAHGVFATADDLSRFLEEKRYPAHEHAYRGQHFWVADIQRNTTNGQTVGVHVRNGKIVVGVWNSRENCFVTINGATNPRDEGDVSLTDVFEQQRRQFAARTGGATTIENGR